MPDFTVELMSDKDRIEVFEDRFTPACPECNSPSVKLNKAEFSKDDGESTTIIKGKWACKQCKHTFNQLPLIGQNVKCDNQKDLISIFGVTFKGSDFRKLLIKPIEEEK